MTTETTGVTVDQGAARSIDRNMRMQPLTPRPLGSTLTDQRIHAMIDRQVIIVENSDPPAAITTRPQVVMFSKNPHSGRYGFFPMAEEPKMLPAPELP
jgi:hypothetical protein